MVTYQKMFSLGAGQTLSDQASVQSGYTLIRDETLLLLAQSLAQLSQEMGGQRKAKTLEDGQLLVGKVKKGKNES